VSARRDRRGPRGRRLAAALALVGLAGGCGWSAGLAPPDLLGPGRTVGVEVFDTSREQVDALGLEPELHAELSRAVSDLVDAPLETPEQADVLVRGRIVEVRHRGGIRRANTGGATQSRNDLLETSLRVVVSVELVDRTSGAILRPARNVAASSGYAVGAENEDQARARVLRYLADSIVLDLFGASAPSPSKHP